MNERHQPATPPQPVRSDRPSTATLRAQPALIPLPAFADNYIWLLHDGRDAWVVDPGDASPVINALERLELVLRGILVTHHHADHIGGIEALRPWLRGAVYGPARERIPQPFVPLSEGDQVLVLADSFRVLDVPGHTSGHIAYLQQARDTASAPLQAPLLFCGDTLFSAGCGRLFDGTPAQMAGSLARLAALPAATRVCCTHEYTLSNLRFAAAVEPDNADIRQHTTRCEALRVQGRPTLPSSIGLEKRINPFLRCNVPTVVAAALATEAASQTQAAAATTDIPRKRPTDTPDPVAILAALRAWKNRS
jgi:hydroxyacylglutathione hydrolase